MPTPVNPDQLWLGGLVLILLSAFAFSRGWLLAGLPLYLLATPFDGVGERLARLRMRSGDPESWIRRMVPLAGAVSLLSLAYSVSVQSGWGCLILAIAIIAFMTALAGERTSGRVPGALFLAEYKGLGWLILPFGATGQWVAGLAALALYATGSFFWAQRQAHGLRAGERPAE